MKNNLQFDDVVSPSTRTHQFWDITHNGIDLKDIENTFLFEKYCFKSNVKFHLIFKGTLLSMKQLPPSLKNKIRYLDTQNEATTPVYAKEHASINQTVS